MAALTLQHRMRLELTLSLLPNRSTPAVQVLLALRSRPAGIPAGIGNKRTWTRVTDTLKDTASSITGLEREAQATQLWHVHDQCSGVARRFAYAQARTQALNESGAIGRVDGDHVVGTPPRHHTPTGMTAFLQCIGRRDNLWDALRGAKPEAMISLDSRLTPASAYGVGGNGSLFALTTRHGTQQVRVIQRLRLGAMALLLHPFAPPRPDGADEEDMSDQAFAIRLAALQHQHCSLPGCHAGEPANPFHLVAACTDAHIVAWRERARATATALVNRLCDTIIAAYNRLEGAASIQVYQARALAACTDLRNAMALSEWDSVDGTQLLVRLLLATPFSAMDVRQPLDMRLHPVAAGAPAAVGPMPVCQALGALLDVTVLPRYAMRSYANAWLTWSHARIVELAGAYCCSGGAAKQYARCMEDGLHAAPRAVQEAEVDLIDCGVEPSA